MNGSTGSEKLRALAGRGFDRRRLLKLGAAGAGAVAASGAFGTFLRASAQGAAGMEVKNDVTIEYWQYEYATKVDLVNKLIPEFEKANPKVKIKHVNFPYDDFQQKVAAAVQAGEGPDVLNMYYGWVPVYAQQQFVIPLPGDAFPADKVEEKFFPMVKTVKIQDSYYALPTAVRTLGLFCNDELLAAAGKKPPANWDELVDVATATTKRNGDKMEIEGITYDPGGQGHSWWANCLTRQNGLTPISEDNKKLSWADPAGVEAFNWYMALIKEHKVAENAFYTDGATAFQTAHAALHVDGSYRVGTYTKNAPDLKYTIVPLPEHKAKASFASFWCNGITRNAGKGDKLAAAAKWIDFLTSEDVMRQWTPAIGELPAAPAIANEETFTKDPKLGAFIEQLPDSHAMFYVNEADTRQAVMDAMDAVLLKNADPAGSVKGAQDKVQQQLDDYWSSF